jgi:hypothetical protein
MRSSRRDILTFLAVIAAQRARAQSFGPAVSALEAPRVRHIDVHMHLIMLSRGNQGRLAAAGAMLSRLPADLAAKIAISNPQRIYRI